MIQVTQPQEIKNHMISFTLLVSLESAIFVANTEPFPNKGFINLIQHASGYSVLDLLSCCKRIQQVKQFTEVHMDVVHIRKVSHLDSELA